jgi:hypothetical protein
VFGLRELLNREGGGRGVIPARLYLNDQRNSSALVERGVASSPAKRGQGTGVKRVSDDLLAALAAAYEEACS